MEVLIKSMFKQYMLENQFIQGQLFGSFTEISKLCLTARCKCANIIDVMANTSARNEEKQKLYKNVKGDLNILHETIENTASSIKGMYNEFAFSMYRIFEIIKTDRQNSLSVKYKQEMIIDTSEYDYEIYKMYKFIKKYSPYKALKNDADHLFSCFNVWYNYAISTINYSFNRIKSIVEEFKLSDEFLAELNKKEQEFMKLF